MITGMDRVRAAAFGTVSDRIPVFCNLLDQGVRELGVAPRRYYSDGALVAKAQLRLREKYGYDNLWAAFYLGKEVGLFGTVEVLYSDDGPPVLADAPVRTGADIEALEVPDDLANHPGFREQMTCLCLLRAEAGGRYPICALVMGAATLASMLMGMEAWLELLMCGPSGARELLLAKCSLFCRRLAATYRAAGVDLIAYSSPFTSADMVPPATLREVTLPWLERDVSIDEGGDMVYFCAIARLAGSLGAVLERRRFGGVYLGPEDDVAAVKRVVAGRALTIATIDDIKMCRWSEGEVRREVERLVRAGMPGGRFLLNTAVMPVAVPERNIRAYVEAACACGRLELEKASSP